MPPILIGLLLFLPLTGCVEKVRFGFRYDYPLVRPNPASGLLAAYTPVVDGRADSSVDEAFKASPIPTITDIVGREIQASLMFERVLPIPQNPAPPLAELQSMKLAVMVEPTLEYLNVGHANAADNVSNFAMWTGAFGPLGAGVALNDEMELEGRAALRVRMTDVASGKWVVRTYSGKAEHRVAVKDLERGPATELLATRALKHAMEQLRADLVRYGQEGQLPPPGPAVTK